MKISPAFFRNEPIISLLDRAVKAIALPMSLHYLAYDGNELHIEGWGQCKVCTKTNKSSKGARACCESRTQAAALTLQQKTPITFVCHLGFTCVSIAALNESNYVITFGPYIPEEINQKISEDVFRRLRKFEDELEVDEAISFALEDVRTIPTGSVSASAEWLVEALHTKWDAYQKPSHLETPANTANNDTEYIPFKKQAASKNPDSGTWVAMAALGLLCGHSTIVTQSIANKLDELKVSTGTQEKSAQAFIIQTVSQIMEAVRQMGNPTDAAMKAYPEFTSDITTMNDSRQMLKYAMRLLRRMHNNGNKPIPAYLPLLIKLIHKNYKKNIELSAFSNEHKVAASSITRALKCRINITFSEYLGRVRIEEAQRLLRNTRLSAAAIGKRVGITDQSNFGKLFLRYTGMNPGAYRKRFQKS
ncbi:MAG: helix-turn-helix domain-containing protein [Candidatus Hydrogenedentes bacterium]|nr:helix-turn-helix domain-containing protein [Candidatus Hydrogenedentota bacterium]